MRYATLYCIYSFHLKPIFVQDKYTNRLVDMLKQEYTKTVPEAEVESEFMYTFSSNPKHTETTYSLK